MSLASPALAGGFFTSSAIWEAQVTCVMPRALTPFPKGIAQSFILVLHQASGAAPLDDDTSCFFLNVTPHNLKTYS